MHPDAHAHPHDGPTSTPPPAGSEALVEALDTSFRLLRWAVAVLAAVYLLSGLFIVPQHERALVLMFGRIAGRDEARVRGPGVHWTLPRPFAEIVRIETERVQTVAVGELPVEDPDLPPEAQPEGPAWDTFFLTGDANLLSARWSLRYTIEDPEAFLFAFRDARALLEAELQHAVVHTSARFEADAALRTDVEAFRAYVGDRIRERIRRLGLGVRIERVELAGVRPPLAVAGAFEAVVQAEQERSRQISEARAYAARRGQETFGEAARTRAQAEADRDRWVASAAADAAYFQAVLEKDIETPGVLRETLRQDALQRALAGVGHTWFIRPGEAGRRELRILLSPERRALMLPGGP
jgi:modulator of FtsH protease HflK